MLETARIVLFVGLVFFAALGLYAYYWNRKERRLRQSHLADTDLPAFAPRNFFLFALLGIGMSGQEGGGDTGGGGDYGSGGGDFSGGDGGGGGF